MTAGKSSLQPNFVNKVLLEHCHSHLFTHCLWLFWEPPRWLSGKEPSYQCRRCRSIPGLGRSPGEENGNTLRQSCLRKSMDRGAWRAAAHGVAKLNTTEHRGMAGVSGHTHLCELSQRLIFWHQDLAPSNSLQDPVLETPQAKQQMSISRQAAQRLPEPTATFGLPSWLSWERICSQCRRPGFNPWTGKIPWRRKRLATPVSLPGESHGQRSLVGYSPWGRKELDTTQQLKQ